MSQSIAAEAEQDGVALPSEGKLPAITPMTLIESAAIEKNINKAISRIDSVYGINYSSAHMPYGQTIHEQNWLLSSLQQEALRQRFSEIEFLTLLLTQPHIDSDQATLFSSYSEESCASFLPDNIKINYFDPMPVFAHQTHSLAACYEQMKRMPTTNSLWIINPYMASLWLLQPLLLQQLTQNIKQTLIFPYYSNPYKFLIEWDDSFGDSEHNAEHYWRWAFATAESHVLILTNNSINTQRITLNFSLWLDSNSRESIFKIYFLNEEIQQFVNHSSVLNITLSIPPGRHRLHLVYDGPVINTTTDFRCLHFALVDLTVNTDTYMLEKETIYSKTALCHFSPHTDAMLRYVLHNSGFFEVSAIVNSFGIKGERHLKTTRYHVVNQYYPYSSTHLPVLDTSEEIVWYVAKRAATFKEEDK